MILSHTEGIKKPYVARKEQFDHHGSTSSVEIITLGHETDDEDFDTFSQNVDELLVDNALSDNNIIGITLDIIKDPENDNEVEKSLSLSLPVMLKIITLKLSWPRSR